MKKQTILTILLIVGILFVGCAKEVPPDVVVDPGEEPDIVKQEPKVEPQEASQPIPRRVLLPLQ